MRGFAIILVVAGHFLQCNGVPLDSPAFEFIYSFHMPLFFFISGFITWKVTNIFCLKNYMEYLKKKFKAIALPFCFWTFVVYPFMFKRDWGFVSTDWFIYHFQHPQLWFLKTLFIILVIFGFYKLITSQNINKFIKEPLALSSILVFTIATYFFKIDGNALLIQTVAFYMGVMASRISKIEKLFSNELVTLVLSLLFAFLVCKWRFFGGGYLYPFLKLIITFCISGVLYKASLFIISSEYSNYITKSLEKFGNQSIYIYILHLPFINILTLPFNWEASTLSIYGLQLNWCSILAFSLIISYLICLLIAGFADMFGYNKYLNLLLFGKIIRKK